MAPPDTLSFLAGSVRTLLKRVHALEESLRSPRKSFSWNVDVQPFFMNVFPTVPPGVHALPHYPPGVFVDEPTQLSEAVQRCERLLHNLLGDVHNISATTSELTKEVAIAAVVPMPEEINMRLSDDFEFRDLCAALRTLSVKRYTFNLGIAILSNDFQSARLGLPTGLSPELQLQFDELYASPNFEVMDFLDKLSLPMIGTKREMIIRLLRHMAGTDD
jgi:hypothetical protein